MIIEGKEIGITKQPFSILKKNVCDDAKDLEDMIKRVKDFEISMNSKVQEIENQPIFNVKENSYNNIEVDNGDIASKEQEYAENRKNIQVESRSLFTKETVERIGHINSSNENYEREA